MKTIATVLTAALALAACEEQSASNPNALPDPGTAAEGFGSRIGNVSPATRNVEVQNRLRGVADALQAFSLANGSLPADLDRLIADGVLTDVTASDPWGNRIRFESTGQDSFRVWTTGPDGEDGTDDDIEVSRS
ncbi:MAG: type II secretion system protein GspG [Planctomycetota bacterium]